MSEPRNEEGVSSQATEVAPQAENPTAQPRRPSGAETPPDGDARSATATGALAHDGSTAAEPTVGVMTDGDEAEQALIRRRVRRTARTEIEAAAAAALAERGLQSESGPDEETPVGVGGVRVNVLGADPSDLRQDGFDGPGPRARRPRDRRQTGPGRDGADVQGSPREGPVADAPRRAEGSRRGDDRGAPSRPRSDRPRSPGPRRPGLGDGVRPPRGGDRPDAPRSDSARGEPRPRRPFDRTRRGPDARVDGPRRGPEGRGRPVRPDAPTGGPSRPSGRLGGPLPQRRPAPAAQSPTTTARSVAAPTVPTQPTKSEDKVTLILHPAPKAAPGRFKPAERPMTAKEALRAKAAKRVAQKGGKPGAGPSTMEPAQPAEPTAELLESWIEADGSNAVAMLSAAGAHAEQVILAWQEHASVEALLAVAATDGTAQEGQVPGVMRKAARRAINVLRSRGVAIPEPAEPKANAVPLTADGALDAPTATFVPPDGTGTVFFSVSQRQAGGRFRVADAVVRDVLGIVHASSGRLAGKQLRRWRDRVEARVGAAPVDVPVDWARWRIAQARLRNATSGQVLPLGLDGCAQLFEPVPEVEPRHPLADLEEQIGEAEATAAAPESGKLHGEPELRSWMADRTAVEAMLRNVGARVGARGTSDQELVNRTLEEEVAAATDRYFTPEARSLLASRLRDTAISVRARAGDDGARRLLALGKAIRDAGLITAPPRDIPFLTTFFRKAIGVLAAQNGGRLNIPVPAPPPATVATADEPAPEAEGTAAPDAAPNEGG